MVQKYVECSGEHSTMFRCDWSCQYTLFSSFTNSNVKTNMKLPLRHRYDTFEVGSMDVHETPIKPEITKNAIEAACRDVSSHLKHCCPGFIKVNSMSILLKCDSENQLWVMFWRSLKLTHFERAAVTRVSPGRKLRSSMDKLGNYPEPSLNRQSGRKDFADLMRNLKSKQPDQDLSIRIRERERIFEPEEFYRSMKLTNHKDQTFSWPKSLPYCRLCLNLRHCGCLLPFRFISYHLKFDAREGLITLDGSEEVVSRFLQKITSTQQTSGNLLIRLKELEEEDVRVVRNQETVDEKVPRLLRWIIGPKTVEEVKDMFGNQTFLRFEIPCCMECYMSYTQKTDLKKDLRNLEFRSLSPALELKKTRPGHSRGQLMPNNTPNSNLKEITLKIPSPSVRRSHVEMMGGNDPRSRENLNEHLTGFPKSKGRNQFDKFKEIPDVIMLPELEADIRREMAVPRSTQDEKLVKKYLIQDIYKIKRKPGQLQLLLDASTDTKLWQRNHAHQNQTYEHVLQDSDAKPHVEHGTTASRSAQSTRIETKKDGQELEYHGMRLKQFRLQTADPVHKMKKKLTLSFDEASGQNRCKSVGPTKSAIPVKDTNHQPPTTHQKQRFHSSKNELRDIGQLETSASFGNQILTLVKELSKFSSLMD